MKERPILMSAPMVRAILSDTKTQTRRVVKVEPPPGAQRVIRPFADERLQWAATDPHDMEQGQLVLGDAPRCPYGQPGDRLWVREAFSGPWCMEAQDGIAAAPPSKWGKSSQIWYWADGDPTHGDWTRPRPSIHMPRWASRITLEVTGVRVERLQDISEADAWAEGCEGYDDDVTGGKSGYSEFHDLWKSINGPESWAANPWVWCVSFRRLEAAC